MSIGTTLSQAREAAGLSVAEVSARTRIRTPLIRAIEGDDFGACGGDFYARGHIRAIARIVGVDSRPLIDAYDGLDPGQRASEPAGIDDLFLPETPEAPGPEPAAEPPAASAQDAPAEEAATAVSPAAEAGDPAPAPRGKPGWQGRALAPLALLAVVALAVIGTGAYKLASGPSGHSAGTTAAGSPKAAVSAPRSSPVRQSSAATAPASPPASAEPTTQSPSPSSSPSPKPAPKKVTLTHVTPSGASADDNSGDASKALGGNEGDPWHTQWYTSSSFGNLKSGTGLTLTLPRTVSATGVTVKFADSGGSMQVKAGSSPGSLHTVASGSAGGTQTLSFSKTSARYIELWFTKLGTSSGGSYQIQVYDVSVSAQKSS